MLYHGDCLDVLGLLDDDAIEALVTDPPAGINFMELAWDDDQGGRDQWVSWFTKVSRECYRVMKPGAHGFVWAYPRTAHWTMLALEEAGFEIRDVFIHVFGGSMPKGFDISKGIDRAARAQRQVVGVNRYAGKRTLSTARTYKVAKYPWEQTKDLAVTVPATEEAKTWEGWSTCVKSAAEHWILVRKPLTESTVVKNVLKWGTGGINIDACRVGDEVRVNKGMSGLGVMHDDQWEPARDHVTVAQGRFPANFLFSHAVDCGETCTESCPSVHLPNPEFFQSFRYEKKANKKERGDNRHPTVKPINLMAYLITLITPPGGTVLDPFMGSGSTGVAAIQRGFTFIGIEKEISFYNIARARIAEAPAEQGETV